MKTKTRWVLLRYSPCYHGCIPVGVFKTFENAVEHQNSEMATYKEGGESYSIIPLEVKI